jgi:hypothetical protein
MREEYSNTSEPNRAEAAAFVEAVAGLLNLSPTSRTARLD